MWSHFRDEYEWEFFDRLSLSVELRRMSGILDKPLNFRERYFFIFFYVGFHTTWTIKWCKRFHMHRFSYIIRHKRYTIRKKYKICASTCKWCQGQASVFILLWFQKNIHTPTPWQKQCHPRPRRRPSPAKQKVSGMIFLFYRSVNGSLLGTVNHSTV